jgi:hypothetical protein
VIENPKIMVNPPKNGIFGFSLLLTSVSTTFAFLSLFMKTGIVANVITKDNIIATKTAGIIGVLIIFAEIPPSS